MPTSEWKAATSCGSEVIWMRLATKAPAPPPMAMPGRTSMIPVGSMPGRNSVATMAIAMPIMPNWLPCREVVGWDSPRSARMKRTAATR